MDIREPLQSVLGDAYRVERELGGGGMSRVFVAHDVALDRDVVVKVLSEELTSGVSADRFRREIYLAAQLQHPHIVPLLSAAESEGLPYFTMPYVDGESLRARLMRERELPVPEAYRERVEAARHELIEAAVEHDEMLLEKYLAGAELSYDEIALALDRPLSDVKSDLFRARKLLAQALKPEELNHD